MSQTRLRPARRDRQIHPAIMALLALGGLLCLLLALELVLLLAAQWEVFGAWLVQVRG